MNAIKIRIIAVLLLLFTINECVLFSSRFRSKDPFYQSSGEREYLRIPLIQPYEAIKGNDQEGWSIDLVASPSEEATYYISIKGAEEIVIQGGIVYVYTSYVEESAIGLEHKILHWFVLDAEKGFEKGFENESDFLEYISKYNVGELNWANLDELFEQYEKTGCLDWVPDCE